MPTVLHKQLGVEGVWGVAFVGREFVQVWVFLVGQDFYLAPPYKMLPDAFCSKHTRGSAEVTGIICAYIQQDYSFHNKLTDFTTDSLKFAAHLKAHCYSWRATQPWEDAMERRTQLKVQNLLTAIFYFNKCQASINLLFIHLKFHVKYTHFSTSSNQSPISYHHKDLQCVATPLEASVSHTITDRRCSWQRW